GDANAGIGNSEDDFLFVWRGGHCNFAALGRVLNGVLKQIVQNFREPPAVSGNVWQAFRQARRKAKFLLLGVRLRRFDAAFHKLRNGKAPYLELEPRGVHLGQHEKVLREPRESPRMLQNDLQETLSVLRIVDRACKKGLREALNGCERRAKFVRDVGDEIPADAFEFSQIRDVMKDDYGAVGFRGTHRGDRRRKEVLAQRARDDFRLYARFAGKDFAHRFDQLRLSHDFHERASRFRRHIQAENLSEALIGERHALSAVHHQNALRHAAQNRRGKIAFLGERADGAVEPAGGLIERTAEKIERIAGAIRGQRTKIALRDAPRKFRQAIDAAR